MIVRLARLSIMTKILFICGLTLVVLAGVLLLVVKQSLEQAMLAQFQTQVSGNASFHRFVVEQKG